jgi:hypothetical protein
MNEKQFKNKLFDVLHGIGMPAETKTKTETITKNFLARIKGQKSAPKKRLAFVEFLRTLKKRVSNPVLTQEERLERWKKQSALRLAEKAEMFYDEHGGNRGDYLSTVPVDFVPPREAAEKPFFDLGNEGLALVRVERTRIYAKSSKWRPSSTTTTYLVGKNEAGTYFSHAVPNCETVAQAIAWIWNGKQENIIHRQGDIALANGKSAGIKKLPSGHKVVGEFIVHDTHPAIPLPGKGQCIIIGRRAAARVSAETRD